jgi:hypothetical protein
MQIRVLEVKDWTPKDNADKNEFAMIPLPTDRDDSIVAPGETYRVCVISLSGCPCSLQLAFEDGEIAIPSDIENVELWSSTDFDEVEEKDDRDFKEAFGKRFYAGHQAKPSKNKVNMFKFMTNQMSDFCDSRIGRKLSLLIQFFKMGRYKLRI